MNNMQSYDKIPPFSMISPEIQDLLLSENQIKTDNEKALGTGIISILGTARSGKTTLAYTLIDWAIHHTKRPIFLSNYPKVIIEKGIPDHWKGRVERRDIEDIWKVEKNENAIWLSDDSAVHTNSRDSLTRKSKLISRLSGILSHLGGGQTLIYTTQSLAGVDKSLFRFCETVTLVRHMNSAGLKGERDEWRDDIDNAIYLLHQAHYHTGSKSKRFRDFYVSISTDNSKPYRIIPYVKPNCLFVDLDAIQRDMLSRPFRYMENEELETMVLQHDVIPDRKKVKKNK